MMELKDNIIIGIAGAHEVGKSTFAHQLALNFVTLGFTLSEDIGILECRDAIDDFIKRIFNYMGDIPSMERGISNAKLHPVFRDMLEIVGPSYKKHFGKSLIVDWFNKVVSALAYENKYHIFIISGIRMPDEAQWIKDHHGMLIMVRRTFKDRDGRIVPRNVLPTEIDLEKLGFQLSIDNDNTMAVFSRRIRYLFDDLVASTWFESKTTTTP